MSKIVDKVQVIMSKEGWTEQTLLRLILAWVAESPGDTLSDSLVRYLESRRAHGQDS